MKDVLRTGRYEQMNPVAYLLTCSQAPVRRVIEDQLEKKKCILLSLFVFYFHLLLLLFLLL